MALADGAAAIGVALLEHHAQHARPEARLQRKIDEAGPGDLGAGDVGVRGEQRDDALGERAWGELRRLRQHHGGIGGEVAVGGVLRRLQRDAVDARVCRHDAVMLELLHRSQDMSVEPSKDVHDSPRRDVAARLTQFRSGVKQAAVLGKGVTVGHAGDEIRDMAGVVVAGCLLPPFRRQRRLVTEIEAE